MNGQGTTPTANGFADIYPDPIPVSTEPTAADAYKSAGEKWTLIKYALWGVLIIAVIREQSQ